MTTDMRSSPRMVPVGETPLNQTRIVRHENLNTVVGEGTPLLADENP
jgi:hypothetical protein